MRRFTPCDVRRACSFTWTCLEAINLTGVYHAVPKCCLLSPPLQMSRLVKGEQATGLTAVKVLLIDISLGICSQDNHFSQEVKPSGRRLKLVLF